MAIEERRLVARRVNGHVRNQCPACGASIDPWRIGNEIFTGRCSKCKSKVWMEYSRAQSVIAMATSIVIVAVPCAMYGWVAMKYLAFLGVLLPILNVYVRILIGYPVAKMISETQDRNSERIR